MSFKREGDDQSQLNVLKKRRVADLLSNFIPDDEAVLMKNGRYSCLVCSHRPVFDTVDMLVVHRKGKRHLEGMKWFYGKKNQLQREIDKRRHQDYVKAEDDRQVSECIFFERMESSGCDQEHRNDQVNNINPHTSTRTGSIDSMSTTSTTVHEGQTEGKVETKKRKKGSSIVTSTDCEPQTAEQRRRELDHYLKLKSSGWLQDRSGKWVKDENVEFDSDEEEPALLPPCSESS
ncbi:Sodium channel modifier 1 [Anabarilius grahami]|uniref:Sodium channel modifier 1 n=1 Tax=Anabarilius grahami TaxID=495550 RepID=A0A3N0XRP4_ANAGA|nr:Sodium channel modifier 1 [Anabarilius grahami]